MVELWFKWDCANSVPTLPSNRHPPQNASCGVWGLSQAEGELLTRCPENTQKFLDKHVLLILILDTHTTTNYYLVIYYY